MFSNYDPEACKTLAQMRAAAHDFEGAQKWCERGLRNHGSDPGLLWMAGALCLARNDPARAASYFAATDRLQGAHDYETRVYRNRHLDITSASRGQPYYRRLGNVLLDTAYWSVMAPEGVVYNADVHGRNLANSPFVHGRVTADGEAIIASYPRPTQRIDVECILVGGDENYSHWLFRNLLKLVALDREGLLYAYPWLVNADLKPHQQQYLDLFGVPPEGLVKVERGRVVACDKLVVPALLTSQRAIKVGIDWLRNRLCDVMVPEAQARELLYVSRADALHRHVLNEEELVSELKKLGFATLVPGRVSVTEQIRAFSAARLIVAVHGAGLTNMIFAPDRARYIEIVSTVLHPMNDFRRIAAARGQTMTTIVSDRYASVQEIEPNTDYYVDVDEILRAVRAALAA